MRSERHAAAHVHRVRHLAAGCRAVLPRPLDPYVEAPVHRPASPAARSRHLTLGHCRRQIRAGQRAVPARVGGGGRSRAGRDYRALPAAGPSQLQRIGQLATIARCLRASRVSRRALGATVRVAAADAKRTSEANTRSTRPTRMTESPREMSGWFWSAVDASGFTSERTSGSPNGRASRHRTGPRRSGANVRPGSRRSKRPNVISVCSWTKCIRLWTATFVYSPPSPRGPSGTAHHNCSELTPRLTSKRSYVVSVPTAE